MKKHYALMALAIAATAGSINAQVVNRAVSFTPEGTVDCGAMPLLDNLKSYSLQFWLMPDKWTPGAYLLSRGDSFTVKLGEPGNIEFKVGDSSATATSSDLKASDWNQVTLICEDGNATMMVNGEEVSTGALGEIPVSTDEFMLGGGYTGLLDEVRVWNDALNEDMKTFDYFTHNTLNKWNPMWENLVAYYKMDQKDCKYLVDYKGIEDKLKSYDNHGVMSDGVNRVEANNEKMPYLINSAYTNNPRFYDRIIPRDQYLLSNDLIVLGVDVFASDGHLETKTPNNHANVSGVDYYDTYEGRKGVIAFKGAESKFEIPAKALKPSTAYTFESWIYLDEWTPGAYLLRKETDDQKNGVAVYLGEDAENPTLIVRVDGKRISSRTLDIPMKEWFHLGIASTNGGSKTYAFSFVINGKTFNGDPNASDDSSNVLPSGNEDCKTYIGENIHAKFDDLCLWNKMLVESEIKKQMTTIPMPGLDRNVTEADMNSAQGFYRFDDVENLGHSSHSQDEWIRIMKSAYEGHAGVSFFISVQGYYTPREPYGDWRNVLSDAKKRERFVSDLVEISKSYDGVELDLEWIEGGPTMWNNYGILCDEIEAALPEGKKFRVSLHNAYYTGFPTDKRSKYDGFTFQQYGPQTTHYSYKNFENRVKNFIDANYPKNKIMTSYSTTTSQGTTKDWKTVDITGVKNGALDEYVPASVEERNYDEWTNSSGTTYRYMGPMQVYARAKHTREENLQGIFYWDMGNDGWKGTVANPIMHEYNMAKYCSYGINANNDTIVNNLNIKHYDPNSSISKIEAGSNSRQISVNPSPAVNDITVSLSNGESIEKVLIYSLTGARVKESLRASRIDVSNLSSGVYMLTATDKRGNRYKTKFIKR